MADIGEEIKEVEFEPMPEQAPVEPAAPKPAPAEPAPA